MLSDRQRHSLFRAVHREIEVCACRAAEVIAGIRPLDGFDYPPNGGLTDAEAVSVASCMRGSEAIGALRKIIADAAAGPMFMLFSLLDGVADPEGLDEAWPPLQLVAATADAREPEMLHDVFFETYWAWRAERPDPGWHLDLLKDPPDEGEDAQERSGRITRA